MFLAFRELYGEPDWNHGSLGIAGILALLFAPLTLIRALKWRKFP